MYQFQPMEWKWKCCVSSKLCMLSPLHLLFQQQDWVHLLTLHHMMEVVRVSVSVLEGQFPDQDRLPIWTIIWENKIFCYDIAFLQRFTSPDQMVETKQPQAYIFFGFWNHLGKWNRHTESKRHSIEAKNPGGVKWVYFPHQFLWSICS